MVMGAVSLPDMLQTDLEQLAEVLIVKPVIKNRTLPPVGNQIKLPQKPKLMADGRFSNTQENRKVAHTHFLMLKCLQNTQPSHVTHGLEQL